jgi:hypothetical protein
MTDVIADRIAAAHAWSQNMDMDCLPHLPLLDYDWNARVLKTGRPFDDDFDREGLADLLRTRWAKAC